jgi:hypothetical protein
MRQVFNILSLSTLLVLSISNCSDAFSVNSPKSDISRRNLLKDLTSATIASVGILNLQNQPANASGGATAGGAYLLSAKQRYNQRVIEGVKAFLALSTSLESGSLEEAKAYFTTDDQGGWKDASAAGYLLSNAFRTSSTKPPDSLPSVKKWKAFAAELDVLQKALKKKDLKGVNKSYANAEILLDAYLEAVELPPVLDMRLG